MIKWRCASQNETRHTIPLTLALALALALVLTSTPQVPRDKVVVRLAKWTASPEEDIFGERSTFLNVKLVDYAHDTGFQVATLILTHNPNANQTVILTADFRLQCYS